VVPPSRAYGSDDPAAVLAPFAEIRDPSWDLRALPRPQPPI
jgi:hypothetical protein